MGSAVHLVEGARGVGVHHVCGPGEDLAAEAKASCVASEPKASTIDGSHAEGGTAFTCVATHGARALHGHLTGINGHQQQGTEGTVGVGSMWAVHCVWVWRSGHPEGEPLGLLLLQVEGEGVLLHLQPRREHLQVTDQR